MATIRNAYTVRRFNGGGPGGQHQNRTESAIELKLTPEAARTIGIPIQTATANGKSQARNLEDARRILAARIRAAIKARDSKARFSAGTDRVRNYHEPDDRVTDASGGRYSYRETVGKGKLAPCIDGRRAALART